MFITLQTVFTYPTVPGPVEDLRLVINDSHLTVTWDVPLMPNGVISVYRVMLSGINLVDSLEIVNSSMNVTQTMYTVAHSSQPYSTYTAEVAAFTSAGFGPVTMVSNQTLAEGEWKL